MKKDIGMMLIAGLKKKKGEPASDDGEMDMEDEESADDGPEYDPGGEAKVKAAGAVRRAIESQATDEEFAEALEAFVSACG